MRYRGKCHLSLVFSSYTHLPKGSCVYGKYRWRMAYSSYSTRKHCMTSIYFIPCLEKYTAANQRPGLPLHILQCTKGNMQRIVFHSTFSSLFACNSLVWSIWGLLKSQLRKSSTPANHYEHFWSRPDIFRKFPNTFEDFRRFSENFKISCHLYFLRIHTSLDWTILNYTILYYTILYYTILYYTILYYTILYYTILYYTILYYTILYYTILYFTILYYTILYYTILYYTILYYTILYYTILYYTILYYTILYYTIIYYTIPYHAIPYFVNKPLPWYVVLSYTGSRLRNCPKSEHLPETKSRANERLWGHFGSRFIKGSFVYGKYKWFNLIHQ